MRAILRAPVVHSFSSRAPIKRTAPEWIRMEKIGKDCIRFEKISMRMEKTEEKNKNRMEEWKRLEKIGKQNEEEDFTLIRHLTDRSKRMKTQGEQVYRLLMSCQMTQHGKSHRHTTENKQNKPESEALKLPMQNSLTRYKPRDEI